MQGEQKMLGYRYKMDFVRSLSGEETPLSKVTNGNVDWHLFQLGRDLSLTKMRYEQKLNFMRNECLLSSSLKSKLNERESVSEIHTYIFVLETFLRYINSKEKPLITDLENIKTQIGNVDQKIKESGDGDLLDVHEKKKTKYQNELSDTQAKLTAFVKVLMSVNIQVDGTNVLLYSEDKDLIAFFRNELRGNEYNLDVISKNGAG